jgi:hypothetical protein
VNAGEVPQCVGDGVAPQVDVMEVLHEAQDVDDIIQVLFL